MNGATLTPTFSETLKATSTSGLRFAFSVNGIIEGAGVGFNSASISSRTLTLTRGNEAEADDTVTVNYNASSAEEKLQDTAGNLVAGFTGQPLRSAPAAPTPEPTPKPTVIPAPAPIPTKPTGLNTATAPGSLFVSVDWDDVEGASTLKVGDFQGLDNLEMINLYDNQLTELPEDLFGGLPKLE